METGPGPRCFRGEDKIELVVPPSEQPDEATAEDETPQGAPIPEDIEGRERADEESEIPPEVRNEEARYQDEHRAAREDANPDQHRDEEEYD